MTLSAKLTMPSVSKGSALRYSKMRLPVKSETPPSLNTHVLMGHLDLPDGAQQQTISSVQNSLCKGVVVGGAIQRQVTQA